NEDERTKLEIYTSSQSDIPVGFVDLESSIYLVDAPVADAWIQNTRVMKDDEGNYSLVGQLRINQSELSEVTILLSFRAFTDSRYLNWDRVALDAAELTESEAGVFDFEIPVELPSSGVLRAE